MVTTPKEWNAITAQLQALSAASRRDRSWYLQRSAQWVLREVSLREPVNESELTQLASKDPFWDGIPMPERGKRIGLALKMLRDAGRIEKRMMARKPNTPPKAEWITAGHKG